MGFSLRGVAVGACVVAMAVACGESSGTGGGRATWVIADGQRIGPTTERLDVEVTRVDCSGGFTGEVLEPTIEYSAEEVVVVFTVEPLDDDSYTCPSNPPVPASLELGRALGSRRLVDGTCRDESIARSAFCSPNDGVRFDATAPDRD